MAGKAYSGRTLEPYPADQGGEFSSMMRVLYPEKLDDPGVQKALQVNKKTKAEILAAPDQKLVWNQFVEWVGRFNPKKTKWTAPIAGGKNIVGFDLKFVEVLNRLHAPKKEKTVLFNERTVLDLEQPLFLWFEADDDPDLPDMKMDTLRDYFGLTKDGAHDALVDVRQTGELLFRILRLHRELRKRTAKDGSPLIKFKGACRKAA